MERIKPQPYDKLLRKARWYLDREIGRMENGN